MCILKLFINNYTIPVLIAIAGWYIAWQTYIRQKRKEVRLEHLKESYFLLKRYTPLMNEAESMEKLSDTNKDKVREKFIELKRQAILGIAKAIHTIQLYGTDEELRETSNLLPNEDGSEQNLKTENIDKVLEVLRTSFHKEIGQRSDIKYDKRWVGFIHNDKDYD